MRAAGYMLGKSRMGGGGGRAARRLDNNVTQWNAEGLQGWEP